MKLKKLCAIVMSCALLITTGCSSTNTQSKDDSKKSDVQETTSASYPIKIKHAYGETIIESEPKNIATISWGNQDVPLALGITPVGVSKANYGETEENGLLPWTGEKYNELGVDKPVVFNDVDGIDYEAISDSNPDVILAAYSGITQEEYDLLSQIAPVVAYPTEAWQTLWRDQININATAIGKKDEGEALVKELETLIKEKTSEYKDIKGKKAEEKIAAPPGAATINEDFLELLDQMEQQYRVVLILYYVEEMSIREISQILQMNENTVKTRLSRGRGVYKKLYLKEHPEFQFE